MAKKTKGRYLRHRTVAPRLSEIIDEAYKLLMFVNPEAENFIIFLGNAEDKDDLTTRIIPVSRESMKEMMDVGSDRVEYTVTTDEENHFVEGKIR